MIHTRESTNGGQRMEGRERLVAVAVDRDKSSQRALKWATENFITRGQTVKLVHVLQRQPSSIPNPADHPVGIDENLVMDLFLPFRCYCTRRQIHCEAVVLEDPDVAKALIEYVTHCGIETLLLGSPSKSGFSRLFKATDIPSSILKWAPDFCNVYVISKGKVSAARTATRPVPNIRADGFRSLQNNEAPSVIENDMYDEMGALDDHNDVSWASTGSWASDSSFVSFYESLLNPHNMDPNARRSTSTNPNSSTKPWDIDAATIPSSFECLEDTNDEMRRLRIELKQTMDMYHAACKEALAAKQKVIQLEEWKRQEEKRIREAHMEEEDEEEEASESSSTVENEKEKCNKEVIEVAEAAQKFIEVVVQKRVEAERKALRRRLLHALDQSHIAVKYQSLFHILAVLFVFYFYFSIS